MKPIERKSGVISRAEGCFLGQLAGDALGSLVEFRTPESILKEYPDGVRLLADGGTWNTIAGQPTDDSEMALMLARMLAERNVYDAAAARSAYLFWLQSRPFDCGNTVRSSLQGSPDRASQANGALMRISPLGIFGASYDSEQVAKWAQQDAGLTHPHPICLQANALFAMAISYAINRGLEPQELFRQITLWATLMSVDPALVEAIKGAEGAPPTDYLHQQGWVLTAFRNALWQLLHAKNLEEGVVGTVMRGGDTDTNAAIAGALLGAVHGVEAIPAQWRECLLNCRPRAGSVGVHRPRPDCFWPVDALALVSRLIASR